MSISMAYGRSNVSTYLLQLFGNIGRVFPKLGSEALGQDQGVEQSRETGPGSLTQKL